MTARHASRISHLEILASTEMDAAFTTTFSPAKILFSFQHFLTVTQTQQVSLVDIECHDFLKYLIQCLVMVENFFIFPI